MAIMSFAHLKNKKVREIEEKAPVPSSRSISPVRVPSTKVMSFAHLKGRKQAATVPEVKAVVEEDPRDKQPVPAVKEPRLFKIPAVMPTALLASVNYCKGCSRFWPASEETQVRTNNPYGRWS